MKTNIFITGSVIGIAAVATVSVKKSGYPKKVNLALGLVEAVAAETSDSCQDAFKAVLQAEPKNGVYVDKTLDHLHRELYRLNKIQTADVEMIFCRLNKVMGINPDTASLSSTAQTATKTDPMGNTIVASVTAPTESWATAAGYTAKATVTSNNTQFLALYWNGSGDSSKGFVIQGSNPMKSDGNTRLRYVQWDRTSTTQTVKFLGTQFSSAGYLQTVAGGTASQTGGDNAVFGRLSFDTSSKAIESQMIMIRAGNTSGTSSAFKCAKTYFKGTLDGSISGYRPAQGMMEALSSSTTDGTGLDGVSGVTDSTSTADKSGTPAPGFDLKTGTFDYSCADLVAANAMSKPFYSSGSTTADVSYSMAPSTVFPK